MYFNIRRTYGAELFWGTSCYACVELKPKERRGNIYGEGSRNNISKVELHALAVLGHLRSIKNTP